MIDNVNPNEKIYASHYNLIVDAVNNFNPYDGEFFNTPSGSKICPNQKVKGLNNIYSLYFDCSRSLSNTLDIYLGNSYDELKTFFGVNEVYYVCQGSLKTLDDSMWEGNDNSYKNGIVHLEDFKLKLFGASGEGEANQIYCQFWKFKDEEEEEEEDQNKKYIIITDDKSYDFTSEKEGAILVGVLILGYIIEKLNTLQNNKILNLFDFDSTIGFYGDADLSVFRQKSIKHISLSGNEALEIYNFHTLSDSVDMRELVQGDMQYDKYYTNADLVSRKILSNGQPEIEYLKLSSIIIFADTEITGNYVQTIERLSSLNKPYFLLYNFDLPDREEYKYTSADYILTRHADDNHARVSYACLSDVAAAISGYLSGISGNASCEICCDSDITGKQKSILSQLSDDTKYLQLFAADKPSTYSIKDPHYVKADGSYFVLNLTFTTPDFGYSGVRYVNYNTVLSAISSDLAMAAGSIPGDSNVTSAASKSITNINNEYYGLYGFKNGDAYTLLNENDKILVKGGTNSNPELKYATLSAIADALSDKIKPGMASISVDCLSGTQETKAELSTLINFRSADDSNVQFQAIQDSAGKVTVKIGVYYV